MPLDDYAEFESEDWAVIRRREDEQVLELERLARMDELGPAWFAGIDEKNEGEQ